MTTDYGELKCKNCNAVCKGLSALNDHEYSCTETEQIVISPALENERIDALYKDPLLLKKLTDMYSEGIVGESDNIKLLFCAGISKDLPRKFRIHCIASGDSSAGKSHLVRSILKPFNSHVIELTDFTPAWLKRQSDSLDGKILLWEQIERKDEDGEVSAANLKFLLSEGKLKVGMVEKDDKGKNAPMTFEVSGTPILITTATSLNIDEETLNRTFLISIDESERQTKGIIKHQLENFAKPDCMKNIDSNIELLQKLVKLYEYEAVDIIREC